jgi:hypothetical protein
MTDANDGEVGESRTYSWYEGFLPKSQSRVVFLLVMLCYDAFIARVMSDIIRMFHLWPTVRDIATGRERLANPGIEGALGSAFFTFPIIESLLLIAVIQLLDRIKATIAVQVIIAALLFSALHSIKFPIWGVLVFPFFILDGATFVYWRKFSIWSAGAMAIALHLLSNSVPTLHMLAGRVR